MTDNTWITRRSILRTGTVAIGLLGLGTRVGTVRADGSSADGCYYQVDFVEGEPIQTLGADEDAFYGRQNRLIQYVHANGNAAIERDTWLNSLDPEVRRCVTADLIRVGNETVSVEFRVEEGCERTLSLTIYPLPGGEFSFEEEQELADAETGTFGPGTHELTVDLSSVGCSQPPGRYDQVATLTADAESDGGFAQSVAVSDDGDVAVVGSPGDQHDDAGRDIGAAYVFERANGTWSLRTRLVADDAWRNDVFGQSVAVSGSGETAVVGAPGDRRDDAGRDAGAAYVFGRADGTWSQRAKLVADDATGGDQFGYSVGVSDAGDTAVVGAPGDEIEDGGYINSGSAYVFGRTGGSWSQRAKLVSDSAVEGDQFGYSVGISAAGDTAVVGSPNDGDDDRGTNAGSAYVFVRSGEGWTQRPKLTPINPARWSGFGESIAVSGPGNVVVVGTGFGAGDDIRRGAAYVFTRSGGEWGQRAKLLSDDPTEQGAFGSAVGVSDAGDVVVVGDPDHDNPTGATFVFGRADETWNQRTKLTPTKSARFGNFGESVALSAPGDTAVVGDPASNDSDAAYVFER